MALTNYLGAKNGAGVYQTIINLIPPHHRYIEAFLGTGAVARHKAPALQTTLIDKNPVCTTEFTGSEQLMVITGCALDWLEANDHSFNEQTVIYLDPPYHASTRTSNARYAFELTAAEHARLLRWASMTSARVLISGYKHDVDGEPVPLYADVLSDWFSADFPAMTRGGVRTETIWCNFKPGEMHYHTHAGKNKDFRQRYKRKGESWSRRYAALEPAERTVVLAALLATEAEMQGS